MFSTINNFSTHLSKTFMNPQRNQFNAAINHIIKRQHSHDIYVLKIFKSKQQFSTKWPTKQAPRTRIPMIYFILTKDEVLANQVPTKTCFTFKACSSSWQLAFSLFDGSCLSFHISFKVLHLQFAHLSLAGRVIHYKKTMFSDQHPGRSGR